MKSKRRSLDTVAIARAMRNNLSRDLLEIQRKQDPVNADSPVSRFINNQLVDFLRKSEFDDQPDALATQKERDAAAAFKFLDVLTHVKDSAVSIGLDIALFSNYKELRSKDWTDGHVFVRNLDRMKCFIHQMLGEVDENYLFSHARNSHGVTLGLKFSQTDLEDKWTYPLTGTADAIQWFESYLQFDDEFRIALEEFNKYSPHPKYQLVPCSRTTGVPKNSKTSRLIAVEGTLNMFYQQACMSALAARLKPWVDLVSAQFKHHELAFIGSVLRNLSTFDFESASDTVVRLLVEYLLQSSWYSALSLGRHSETCLNFEFIHESDVIQDLPMFSTMGNATTFPLETLIFLSALVVLNSDFPTEYSHFPTECWNIKNVSVFGDDCICPTTLNDRFVTLITRCGFIVNKEKSHFDPADCFRESCGVDFYRGHNIRSAYLGEPHNRSRNSLEAWLYTACNMVLKKFILNFGRLHYVYVCQRFLGFMVKIFWNNNIDVKFVPDYFPEDSGIHFYGDPRLLRHFEQPKLQISPITTDRHGTVYFKFLRFSYRDGHRPDAPLRYVTWLKSHCQGENRVAVEWWEPYDNSRVDKPYLTLQEELLRVAKLSSKTAPRLTLKIKGSKVLRIRNPKPQIVCSIDTFVRRTTKKVGVYRSTPATGMMLVA